MTDHGHITVLDPNATPSAGGQVLRLPVRVAPGRLLTKKQLAAELGRSTRWIELRMRESMPVEPRRTPGEHARFDLVAVRAWLDQQATGKPVSLEARVSQLERQLASVTARLEREAS